MTADRRPTILVADDRPHFGCMLNYAHEEGSELRYVVVNSGKRALDVLRQGQAVDLLVVDLLLDGDRGLELLHEVRALATRPPLPAIVLYPFLLGPDERATLLSCRVAAVLPRTVELARLEYEIYQYLHPEAKEKRRTPRVTSSVAVLVEHGAVAFTTTAFDLSESGMFVRTVEGEQAEPGDEVKLTLWLPGDDDLIRLRARVAWRSAQAERSLACRPRGFGVAYLDAGAEATESLRRYVRRRFLIDEPPPRRPRDPALRAP